MLFQLEDLLHQTFIHLGILGLYGHGGTQIVDASVRLFLLRNLGELVVQLLDLSVLQVELLLEVALVLQPLLHHVLQLDFEFNKLIPLQLTRVVFCRQIVETLGQSEELVFLLFLLQLHLENSVLKVADFASQTLIRLLLLLQFQLRV